MTDTNATIAFVSDEENPEILVFDYVLGEFVGTLDSGAGGDEDNYPHYLALSRDGSRLYACSANDDFSKLYSFSVASDTLLNTADVQDLGQAMNGGGVESSLPVTHGGDFVTGGYAQGNSVDRMDTASFVVLNIYDYYPIRGIALGPDDAKGFVWGSGGDQEVYVYDVTAGAVDAGSPIALTIIQVVGWQDPAGSRLFMFNNGTGGAEMQAVDTGTLVADAAVALPAGGYPYQAQFSNDSSRLYLLTDDPDAVLVIDASDGTVLSQIDLSAHGDPGGYMAINRAGTKLAVSRYGPAWVALIDIGTETIGWIEMTRVCAQPVFSPDGSKIVLPAAPDYVASIDVSSFSEEFVVATPSPGYPRAVAVLGPLLATQYQRIFGWRLNISDDALETVDPMLMSPESGSG